MPNEPLDKQLSYHCFNGDKSQVALSKNDETVYLYKTKGSDDPKSWELTQTVREHGGQVSGIDWCAKTNQIVTCAHDRNAYVWKWDEKEQQFKPTLVILRINRAATCVKWSPNGDKFAVGSGAKCVPVCHFEANQNWWISKMIKKHKSTVNDLAWSPNQKYLVTGACDFKCRVFSAFIAGIDTDEADLISGLAPKAHEFGEVLFEFDQAKAWVQGVSWAPSSNRIVFAGHGSTMTWVHFTESGPHTTTVYQKGLPTLRAFFADDDNVVAIGFDLNPTTYKCTGSDDSPAWEQDKRLDPESGAKKAVAKSSASAARNMFMQADSRGMSGNSKGKSKQSPEINTIHKNTILCFQQHGKSFTTSGIDGRIVSWSL